ncbi:3-ketoacyl-acyl carrier protein reductase [Xylaria flabelliformis]|nr:3-ketoacyl-acyl carrier protein reductase [Xylaria flabelliformis]
MADYALPLSGKVVVVTGGSRSIGEAIAMELAKRGATVVITYVSAKSETRVKDICARIEALPHKPSAHFIQADLSTLSAPEKVKSSLLAWRGKDLSIDIIVNNAGVERVKGLGEISLDDYDAVFNLNVRGVILLTQALLPYLNKNGRIINIGSVGGRSAFKDLSLYCASKAALEGLTRSWAAELGGNGTTVNCIAPGPVASELLDNIPKDIVERQKATTPIGNRLGTAEEIANVVAGLAGKDGAWITGQVISASGGWAVY